MDDVSTTLEALRRRWRGLYHIWFDDNMAKYGALPLSGFKDSDPMYADTAEALAGMIRADAKKRTAR